MTPKVQATKEKIDKLNLIKIKNFWTSWHYQESKEIIHRIGENIANHRSGNGLVSRTYKEHL